MKRTFPFWLVGQVIFAIGLVLFGYYLGLSDLLLIGLAFMMGSFPASVIYSAMIEKEGKLYRFEDLSNNQKFKLINCKATSFEPSESFCHVLLMNGKTVAGQYILLLRNDLFLEDIKEGRFYVKQKEGISTWYSSAMVKELEAGKLALPSLVKL
ncbi:hypothetical protein A2733_01120 [Candidatus Nomurabacteria bacterium RIFCSPHIGHO2_01_FULL_40_20]|uniref:Uncharacterized protein n=1 Tax=Candidatus Nomurabacteria bacterium RIFCSPHIGHO2_01_FULL_40_20 TaxID=1801738 RepID=A0A1F6V2W3_9BACT|nr:MAG: hypothetical protein A2733_01120 [Candidatus Nomurabacteria bacterium RIFCSPHIGHO2_01_FULL_40_20]